MVVPGPFMASGNGHVGMGFALRKGRKGVISVV